MALTALRHGGSLRWRPSVRWGFVMLGFGVVAACVAFGPVFTPEERAEQFSRARGNPWHSQTAAQLERRLTELRAVAVDRDAGRAGEISLLQALQHHSEAWAVEG